LPARVLIVPGLGDSGPAHWQSRFQAHYPNSRRVVQRDWVRPTRADWLAALDHVVADTPEPSVLVGHSLGCALIADWAGSLHRPSVIGAFMVAPSDVDSPAHTPDSVRVFAPMPVRRLPFRSIVVASSNDPFYAMNRARYFAAAWGAEFVDIGPAGHINADSGHGEWPEGRILLKKLISP
jgi:predicted alpha/beta hydrolase family esterase